MAYTFIKAIKSLKPNERKIAKEALKEILEIKSDRSFDRIKMGTTPIDSRKIEPVAEYFRKLGILEIWD